MTIVFGFTFEPIYMLSYPVLPECNNQKYDRSFFLIMQCKTMIFLFDQTLTAVRHFLKSIKPKK